MPKRERRRHVGEAATPGRDAAGRGRNGRRGGQQIEETTMGQAAIQITAGIRSRWVRALAVMGLMALPPVMLLSAPVVVYAVWKALYG
ncbi:hypothetical protein GCM10011390_39570 [Aureimonas endophytica]|jgi:hypothetical protein|uniref:Uncharacterized protein n=1 Tax=Aureimonas endophytica TaxID=2027858 RepID=A0A916ZX09_9HYPH|nr:hypothetical protein [Aureimonas psammosilenae]GGE16581.1 hypothetical protein GCM10011390_39570 [Aureimonas endophytica]